MPPASSATASSSNSVLSALQPFIGKVETAIINPLVELIALAAFIMFVWGVVEFILALQGGSVTTGTETKANPGIQTGQQHMIWGLIGLVIIFGAKAIISIAANTFGLTVPQ